MSAAAFEDLIVRTQQSDTQMEKEVKKAPVRAAIKPAKASGEEHAKGFLPGVARKVLLGDAFTARKLDNIADITLQSGRVAIFGKSLGVKSQITRQKNAYIMQLQVTDLKETILVKWDGLAQRGAEGDEVPRARRDGRHTRRGAL